MTLSSSQASLEWTEVKPTKKNPKTPIKSSLQNIIIKPSSTITTPSIRRQSPTEIEIESNNREQLSINNDVIVHSVNDKKFEIPKLYKSKIIKTDEIKNKFGKNLLTITLEDQETRDKLIKEFKLNENFQIYERLTKFNAKVNRELKNLFNNELISGKRRGESNFEVMIKPKTEFIPVNCEMVLNRVIKEANRLAATRMREEIEENRENQLKLHKRIVLTGFPVHFAVNPKAIVQKFAEIHRMKFEDIEKFYFYTDKITKKELNIDFVEKSTQVTVLNMACNVFLFDLLKYSPKDVQNCRIKIEQPLTAFNRSVESKLKSALMGKKILRFELYDQRFRFKVNKNSKWTVIACNNDVKLFL